MRARKPYASAVVNFASTSQHQPVPEDTISSPQQDHPKFIHFLHDSRVVVVLLPAVSLLILVGGQTVLGILSFCFLLLYVADLMQATSAGVIFTLVLHVCVVVGICRACLPLVFQSFWNVTILGLVLMVGAGSLAWSVLHFHELRRHHTAILDRLEKNVVIAAPPACIGVVAWGALSFFGPELAPWISLLFACLSDYALSNATLKSSFFIASVKSVIIPKTGPG